MVSSNNESSDATHPNHDSLDEPAAHARAQVDRPRSGMWIFLVITLVGIAAFAIGRSSKGKSPSASASTATTSPAHAHDTESETSQQLWTCSMHPQVIQPDPGMCPICHMELTPLNAAGDSAGGAITIDPVIVQNMGIRIAEVARGPVMQSARAVGYLEEPEPLHRDINLRVNGWIEKLYANIDGMTIQKGKPLFDLYSPELMVAVDELIAARRQLDGNQSDATLKSMMDSARRKLSQYGLEPQQIDGLAELETAPTSVPILAPIDGHLTAKMVYEGASVKSGDLVLRLASRHQMWIDAQVPEQQLSLISNGQPVRATVVSQPGKVYSGKVLFIHPHIDPQTRTALVRVEIDNQDLALRQGMYATVEILADAYREAAMVPSEAVINTGRRQLVFVSLGEGRFAPRDVRLGLPGQNGVVEVIEGVSAGEKVVTSGQFLLDSESRLKDAVAKHLSGGLAGHAAHGGAVATASGPSTRTAATQPVIDRIAVPHADDIMREYLAIASKLGARQEQDTPVDVKAMIDSSSMAAEHGQGDAKALASSIADAAKAMAGKPLPEQRQAFVALSNAVTDLSRKARISKEIGPTIFVMHCPMAFEDKGANWLQNTEKLANPYYATQMKQCGEIVERIELGR